MKTMKKAISLIMALTFVLLCIPATIFGASAETAKKNVNVVFVLDTTGSMGGEISSVRTNLSTFVEQFSKLTNIDLRMSLVEYRDTTCDGMDSTIVHKSTIGSPWFFDASEMKNTIAKMSAHGGGDIEETLFDALGYLVCGSGYDNAVLFNSNAYKFAFVLTDADVKTTNRFGITDMSDMVSRLVANGIYTSVVSPSEYKTYYESLYETTGGIWMDIYGDFASNMYAFAQEILSVVRPDVVDIELKQGTTYNFKALAAAYDLNTASATYSSSKASVLKMSETTAYLGTALAIGQSIVTISDGKKVLECNVTVKEEVIDPVKELKISTEVTVGIDQTVFIKAIALPEEAKEKGLIWSVKDSSIVEILETTENLCKMKGLKTGKTMLTAVTKDGGYAGSAEITVTINPIIPVTDVTISMTACTLAIGERRSVTGTVLPSNATNKGGYWYSSNSSIVKIISSNSETCEFEAVHCGVAKVYFVSNEGGFSRYVTVTVPHVEDPEAKVLEPATCAKEGTIAHLCSICGEILRTTPIEKTGHSFGEWVFVEDHSGALIGYNQRTCSICGAVERENVFGSIHFYTLEASGQYGDTIDLKICMEAGDYMNDLQATFNYDNSIFEVVSVEFENKTAIVQNAIIDAAKGEIKLLYSNGFATPAGGVFATVKLRINKKVAFKTVPALWLKEESYHVAHVLVGGETYTIDINMNDSFGLVNIWGKDPNGDGELNIFDLYEILKSLRGEYDPHDATLVELYDCNYDGVVDIADITYLQNIIVMFD